MTTKKSRGGAPSWMVTFADLMALLTTFFVLLLSVSQIDAQRYRQIAGSLERAFGIQWLTQRSESPGHEVLMEGKPSGMVEPLEVTPPAAPEDAVEPALDHNLERFHTGLLDDIRDELLEVSRNTEGELLISFRHEAAFESGSEVLLPRFRPVVDRIGRLIATTHGTVIVAGHTDDRPISTARFRSNWDLSTARAVSVVHRLLEMHTVAAERLIAEGYGDARPLLPNDSEANRARNRRVEIRIKDRSETP
ncbi:flagellar motor protein MotB [Sulfurivermis fontis]|uniref:flagellar motor protein MotB n=1 Tax=Sulfurivermis fontis TaxID=1972068 RepID=UPI000FDA4D64|nr:flagellar motor protein MotB [Sulfurivermis fontis]